MKKINILKDIKSFNSKQLFVKYRILLNDDGSVFDNVNKKLYTNLMDWANTETIISYIKK